MATLKTSDKVILGGGLVLLVGSVVWSAFLSSEKDYNIVAQEEATQSTKSNVESARLVQRVLQDSAKIKNASVTSASKQNFDMFVAPMLFASKEKPAELIDLYTTAPVHGEVPNTWFIENNLLSEIEKVDALDQDPDNDGFTLLEEYKGRTDPNKAESHPPLLAKLKLDDINVESFSLIFSMDTDPTFSLKTEGLTTPKTPDLKEVKASEVKVGSDFGSGPAQFKFVKVEKKEFDNMGMKEKENVLFIEDLNPDRKGQVYELRMGKKNAKKIDTRFAQFRIAAGPNKGEEFVVQQGKQFNIPGNTTDKYILDSVDAEKNIAVVKPVGESKQDPRIINAEPKAPVETKPEAKPTQKPGLDDE